MWICLGLLHTRGVSTLDRFFKKWETTDIIIINFIYTAVFKNKLKKGFAKLKTRSNM